jgi:hypothetical protein
MESIDMLSGNDIWLHQHDNREGNTIPGTPIEPEDTEGHFLGSSYPELFDGIGWDANNDMFAHNMMAHNGEGLNMTLNIYDTLGGMSGNKEGQLDFCSPHEPHDGGDATAITGEVNNFQRKLGVASRHGSNEKLDQDYSPKGSSRSQQTGLLVESPRRPVRTKSLPKRLADSHMTDKVGYHSPTTMLYPVKSIMSDQVSSSVGISAQSQNDPGYLQQTRANKRKHASGRNSVNDSRGVVVSSKRVPQAIRATSARIESRGKPSFAELVSSGLMVPGMHTFYIGQVPVAAEVCDDGAILYNETRYRAVSKFALQVLRLRNPSRQSCDGWKEVSWNGEKLDKVRVRALTALRRQHRQSERDAVRLSIPQKMCS